MAKFQIHIAKPCSVKKDLMQPTKRGAFCFSCQKEVVDFTVMSDRQLKKFLLKENHGCGRFTKDQLSKIYQEPAVSSSWWRWAVAACLSLITPAVAHAQSSPVENRGAQKENRPKRNSGKQADELPKEAVVTDTLWTIRGQVTDKSSGVPLPGVLVRLKGTTIGANTDINGNYTILVAAGTVAPILTYSFVGYQDLENSIAPDMHQVDAILAEDVEGGFVVVRKFSPRWFWWQIKGLF